MVNIFFFSLFHLYVCILGFFILYISVDSTRACFSFNSRSFAILLLPQSSRKMFSILSLFFSYCIHIYFSFPIRNLFPPNIHHLFSAVGVFSSLPSHHHRPLCPALFTHAKRIGRRDPSTAHQAAQLNTNNSQDPINKSSYVDKMLQKRVENAWTSWGGYVDISRFFLSWTLNTVGGGVGE